MAKGKLTKMLKKVQSMGRHPRPTTPSATATADTDTLSRPSITYSGDLCPVYVGKARRRYLVSHEVVDHPLFRELVDRSPAIDGSEEIAVACEVVLFEHLLWMLENADPQPDSLDELVGYYACS